jgi:signal transduction histidine kinase
MTPVNADALHTAPARLVAAADADRRRIERALHDGVQQDLIALAVNLQLARDLCHSDPAAVDAFLEELGRDVHAALDAVRELAQVVYPQVLIDHGIVEALRAAASASEVPARIDASGLGRYSPEVEGTVYFCWVDALKGSGPATIRVWQEDRSLAFEVIARQPSQDLSLVRDRVGALGGRLAISSEAGDSTRMSGTLPLEAGLATPRCESLGQAPRKEPRT